MARRLSALEKGNRLELEKHEAPRTARVRAQEIENPKLLFRHLLSIIGRVTNLSAQKVSNLISSFTDLWVTERKTVGADLGNGTFLFQFDLESDLLSVLEKQPYNYGRWMVILQRWEPTISPNFPSLIPFWIKVRGIPLHLWTEGTIRSIADDLGVYDTIEIPSLSVRMRVHVNGRLPLIKTYTVEYPNGDEITATLVYEKLERHCSTCFRLDHEVRDCLEAKHQKKAQVAMEETRKALSHSQNQNNQDEASSYNKDKTFHFTATRRQEEYRPLPYRASQHRRDYHKYEAESQTRVGGGKRNRAEAHDPPPNRGKSHLREPNRHESSGRNRYSHRRNEGPGGHSSRSDIVKCKGPDQTTLMNKWALLRMPRVVLQGGFPFGMNVSKNMRTSHMHCMARKERFRKAEEEGQIAEKALQMARNSLAATPIPHFHQLNEYSF
ncbi:hypothetical protein Bca101_043169 [Brassica carinata]